MLNSETIIVTGGLGFIGKNICRYLSEHFSRKLIIDKVTYASDLDYYHDELKTLGWELIRCDINAIDQIVDQIPSEAIVLNLAAESHVDKSFENVKDFISSNVLGVQKLATYCINANHRLLHISTDEVYGEQTEHAVDECCPLSPTNPYSATKAAGDIFVQTYSRCFGLDAKIIRANNIFGARQLDEKLIPKAIKFASGKQIFYLHGKKELRRHFLHTDDLARALMVVLRNWTSDTNKIYNIAGDFEVLVSDVVRFVYARIGCDDTYIEYTNDRPFNDTRYMINDNVIRSLGWAPNINFWSELEKLCDDLSFLKRSE